MLFSNDGSGDGGDGRRSGDGGDGGGLSVQTHCWLELVLWLRELLQLSLQHSYYCCGSSFQITYNHISYRPILV